MPLNDNEISGLVSVIIPTYNRAPYIIDSVESVLDQDYKNVEVVVVDDHSNDNTLQLLNEKYSNDSRVKYVLSGAELRGANNARNFGLSVANGEYIAFLDSDDLLSDHSLSYRVDAMVDHPDIDMVYGDVYVDDHIVYYDKIQDFNQNRYLMKELSLCCYIVMLVRKRAIKKIYPLDKSLKAWQDDALVLALNKSNCRMFHCGKPCAIIRRLDESITTRHHNMYYSLPLLVSKYREDIIKETSHFRLFLWKLRIILDYLYTKKEDSKNGFVRCAYSLLIFAVYIICKLSFRHIYG